MPGTPGAQQHPLQAQCPPCGVGGTVAAVNLKDKIKEKGSLSVNMGTYFTAVSRYAFTS